MEEELYTHAQGNLIWVLFVYLQNCYCWTQPQQNRLVKYRQTAYQVPGARCYIPGAAWRSVDLLVPNHNPSAIGAEGPALISSTHYGWRYRHCFTMFAILRIGHGMVLIRVAFVVLYHKNKKQNSFGEERCEALGLREDHLSLKVRRVWMKC